MSTDFLEILSQIVEGINKNYSIDKILETIKSTRNVNKNLVAAIYSWIFEKISKDSTENTEIKTSKKGIRIFSEEEKDLMGLENCNYLIHLYNMGLLNNSDLDKIVEQAYSFPEGEIDFEQLNLMVLSIFLETNSDLPPGSRLLLHSSDTIN